MVEVAGLPLLLLPVPAVPANLAASTLTPPFQKITPSKLTTVPALLTARTPTAVLAAAAAAGAVGRVRVALVLAGTVQFNWILPFSPVAHDTFTTFSVVVARVQGQWQRSWPAAEFRASGRDQGQWQRSWPAAEFIHP
jgi:hypothetical protein